MCGITGFWLHHALQDSDQQNIHPMLEAIHHRGPDSRGYHEDIDDGLIMGHDRLSIIDLYTGDQPLYNKSKSIVLTANGEIYDYKRIRADLMSRGEHFTTKTDSELIINLYEMLGLEEFTKHLRGEFAFSLFDKKKQRLILVRDRFGVRPLFYYHNGKDFFYGSEVKSLLAHPQVPQKMNHQAIIHQLMQTMVPGTSLFQDIHALRPGHMLIVERRGNNLHIEDRQYWDAVFPTVDQFPETFDEQEWIEKVRAELIEAVTLRLEADVPVGCYLSGGIDSCCILGLATGAQQSPVKAYTISFDHGDYDESQIAIEMAQSMNADQEILKLSANELYGDYYIRSLWHSERTFYNTLGVAKWHMSRRVKESGFKVVVTGEGSDELFAGYPFFKRDWFLHAPEGKQYRDLWNKGNKVFTGSILSEKQVSHPAFNDLMGFTPSWIQTWMLTLEQARQLLHPDIRQELADYDPIAAIAGQFEPDKLLGRHPLDQVQYTWIKTMLEGQILNWGGDRVDMANSMESRPPFLDHHLAQLAFTVPHTLRIKGNTEKYILREAVKGVLPEVLYKREKFAFMAPPGHTDEKKVQALASLTDRFLSTQALKQTGIYDQQKVAQFMADYKKDTDSISLIRKDALLNHILGLQILHGLFVSNDVTPTI